MKIRSQCKISLFVLCAVFFTMSIPSLVYSAIIDQDTIELAYLFEEGSGDVAKDSSGNDRNANIIGAKYVNDGRFGKALQFDGVGNHLIVPDFAGVGALEPRTTVFWFKADETREHSWIKWGRNSGGQKYYIRAHVSGAQCFLRVEVNGGQNYGADDVCDGKWHHCVVVFPEGGTSVQDHELYVDGKQQTKGGGDRDMNTDGATVPINIGSRLTGHSFLSGLMDEVAIFNVELTENQINALRNNGLKGALSVDPDGKLATSWANIKTY